MGHTTLCSKVLVPCSFKCGSYVQRADLKKHKAECLNNVRRSIRFENTSLKDNLGTYTNSLDRKGISPAEKSKIQDEISTLNRRFFELEARLSRLSHTNNSGSPDLHSANAFSNTIEEIKSALKQHSLSIQKANYFNGYISEWKKNMDVQISNLKSALTSIEALKSESSKQWLYVKEKLSTLHNLQMDLNVLNEAVYKDNTHFKKTQMDFAVNLEEIRSTFNNQNISFENMWRNQDLLIQNILRDIQTVKQTVDEQKAKYAGLIFDFRSVSQISSEAAEKIEILEREFNLVRQEVNQMKINLEIIEDLSSQEKVACQRLIWKVTEVDSKLKRAKANDIVLKSPIFYTHRYGYKIRVLLYINGLKKWKDRYALACIHVLKGEYDPLLTWPCIIEGNITLRDITKNSQPKNFTKYIKTKRAKGDEDEDEPQESSSTYIFIPHSVLLKPCYLVDDAFFLDISIAGSEAKQETSL